MNLLSVGTCPACGKVCFRSRKDAKVASRRMNPGGAPLSAYRCGDYWHVGHLPSDVRRGVRGRETMTPPLPRVRPGRSTP